MRKGLVHGKRDYTPVSWDHYFEKVEDVKISADVSFFHFFIASLWCATVQASISVILLRCLSAYVAETLCMIEAVNCTVIWRII